MQYRLTTYAEDVWDVYWFERNLQGDIVAVYNTTGTKLISYTYDAWGNFTTTYYNNGASTTAVKNPFKYRGYYYDEDLGLYYLQTRYYDSVTGRFISPDDISYLGANGDLIGYNLYAYCSNNPVMYTDPSGEFISAILAGAVIGFVIGATSSVVSQLLENNFDWEEVNIGEVAYDGVVGAIGGAFASSGISGVASIAIGAASGFVSSIGKDMIFNNGDIDYGKAAINGVFGGIAGAISGPGADNLADGQHVTKFINGSNILESTIANGSTSFISRQAAAVGVHASNLVVSGVRYLLANAFSILSSQLGGK